MLKWRVNSPGQQCHENRMPSSPQNSSEDSHSCNSQDTNEEPLDIALIANHSSDPLDNVYSNRNSDEKTSCKSIFSTRSIDETLCNENNSNREDNDNKYSDVSDFNSGDFSILSHSSNNSDKCYSCNNSNSNENVSYHSFRLKAASGNSDNNINISCDPHQQLLEHSNKLTFMNERKGQKNPQSDEFGVLKTNIIEKPPRKSTQNVKDFVRVEVHSDNNPNEFMNQRNRSFSRSKSSSVSSRDIGTAACQSSSEDSIATRRTSIASGFTSLVIEAAFETYLLDDQEDKNSIPLNGVARDVKYSNSESKSSSNMLTVCGNDTDDNIYSEACMIFGSESTIYERMNGNLSHLNRSNCKRHFKNYCDQRFNNTLPHSPKDPIYDEPKRNVFPSSINNESAPMELENTIFNCGFDEMSTVITKKSARQPQKVSDSYENSIIMRKEVPPIRSKSAENLISSSMKNAVTFDDETERVTTRDKKSKSTWDKMNFTGSLGKRRSRLLDSVFKFSNVANDRSKSVESNTKDLTMNEDLMSKRSSSDSKLLEDQISKYSDDELSDDINHTHERTETVNSSFRQRISKFFQDCPKYPGINKVRHREYSQKSIACPSHRQKNDNKNENITHWPLKVKLVKIKKVVNNSTDGQLEQNEKVRNFRKSITKNVYKIIPRTKERNETAKFYLGEGPSLVDATKNEPLHDVQFFHTPRVKAKPPDKVFNSISTEHSTDKSTPTIKAMFSNFMNQTSLIEIDSVARKNTRLRCDHVYEPCQKYDQYRPSCNEVKVPLVIPKPRTIFHTRISPSLLLRNQVQFSITANYQPFSRILNHTIPKGNHARSSNAVFYDMVDLSASTSYGHENETSSNQSSDFGSEFSIDDSDDKPPIKFDRELLQNEFSPLWVSKSSSSTLINRYNT